MKKLKVLIVVFCGIMLLPSCSEKDCEKECEIDHEKEKAAIMALIQKESETARDGDVEGLKSCYIQDEFQTRLSVWDEGYLIRTGWDSLDIHFDNYGDREGDEEFDVTVMKENPVIKIMGKTAWLICDNTWKGTYDGEEINNKSLQVSFFEKIEGEWKFSFAGWIMKPQPDDDDNEHNDNHEYEDDNEEHENED